MRLATWNIRWGRRIDTDPRAAVISDAACLREIGEAVADLRIDVLALQEVDQKLARSGRTRQVDAIAQAMGAAPGQYRFTAHNLGSATGLRMRPLRSDAHGLPAFGIGLCATVPVRSWHILTFPLRLPDISLWSGPEPWYRRVSVFDLTRSLSAAVVNPAAPVTVACFHAPVPTHAGREQLATAAAALGTLPGPRIIMGDFNADPAGAAAGIGWHSLADGLTYPAPQPRIQLDGVICDRPLAVTASAVETLPFSDHRLLWADVDVPDAGRAQ